MPKAALIAGAMIDRFRLFLDARRKPLRAMMLVFLVVMAVASVGHAVHRSQASGVDMIWGSLVLFWQDHLDPYQEILTGRLGDDIAKHIHGASESIAIGQYNFNIQSTFFLLAPLGFMSFSAAKTVWAAANLLFLFGTCFVLYRRSDKRLRWPLILLFFGSVSVRAVIINGQLSLFCLFCYALYLWFADKRPALAALFGGFGAGKYSLGVPLFFQMRLTPANVLVFATPLLASVVYWAFYFHLGLIDAALLPMQIRRFVMTYDDGLGDLLMVIRGLGVPQVLGDALAVAVLVAASFLQKRYLPTNDRMLLFAFYATLGLWLVYHQIYDFVFLLPAAIICVRSVLPVVRYGLFVCIGYIWYAIPIMDDVLHVVLPQLLNLFVMLCVQGFIYWEMWSRNKQAPGTVRPSIAPTAGL